MGSRKSKPPVSQTSWGRFRQEVRRLGRVICRWILPYIEEAVPNIQERKTSARSPRASSAKDRLGRVGERAAVRYLKRKGYRVLSRNERFARGELDIVALDGETLVFVEVKTRRSGQDGGPVGAVTPAKQRTILALSDAYVARHRLHDRARRFDIVALVWPDGGKPTMEHLVDAFDGNTSCR